MRKTKIFTLRAICISVLLAGCNLTEANTASLSTATSSQVAERVEVSESSEIADENGNQMKVMTEEELPEDIKEYLKDFEKITKEDIESILKSSGLEKELKDRYFDMTVAYTDNDLTTLDTKDKELFYMLDGTMHLKDTWKDLGYLLDFEYQGDIAYFDRNETSFDIALDKKEENKDHIFSGYTSVGIKEDGKVVRGLSKELLKSDKQKVFETLVNTADIHNLLYLKDALTYMETNEEENPFERLYVKEDEKELRIFSMPLVYFDLGEEREYLSTNEYVFTKGDSLNVRVINVEQMGSTNKRAYVREIKEIEDFEFTVPSDYTEVAVYDDSVAGSAEK